MNRRSFLAVPLLTLAGCSRPGSRVVLYCAQDREFAEELLADFTRETGVAVVPKFDTEAQKSVSLAAELEREAGRPRCDVHWNNELTYYSTRDPRYRPVVLTDDTLWFVDGDWTNVGTANLVALRTSDGFNLGALCVIDTQPHVCTDAERAKMEARARGSPG